MIGILLGMQSGFTKFCCFLCEWDSRAEDKHYNIVDWPIRKNLIPGEKSVRNHPLLEKDKILLPPLHIKLGLMKIFVKALDKHGEGFGYLRKTFPKLSDSKLKEGIFIGPQIREIIHDDNFVELRKREMRMVSFQTSML